MPTIGSFHAKYWRARANVPIPPGTTGAMTYPNWQAVVTTMHMAIWGVSFDAVRPVWHQARWLWALARRLWWWRAPDRRAHLERWIAQIETLDEERLRVLAHAATLLHAPEWAQAQAEVRACAVTPKFHLPEHWRDYGRALKANAGQAQNVYRHVKVVHALRADTSLSNPDAHLLAELAYQGFALTDPREKEIVTRTVLAS